MAVLEYKVIINDYFLTKEYFSVLKNNDINVSIVNEYVPSRKLKNDMCYQLIEKRTMSFLRFLVFLFLRKMESRDVKKNVLIYSVDDIRELSFLIKEFYRCEKIFLWLWNPMSSIAKNKVDRYLFLFFIKLFKLEVFTFDSNDAFKYKLNYHNQIFPFDLIKKHCIKSEKKTIDVFSFGKNKNRLSIVNDVRELVINYGFSADFKVLVDKETTDYNCFNEIITHDGLPYKEYLSKVASSKAVLDIVQNGQTGLTVRVIESLALHAKLITNNRAIKTYSFFNEKNIILIDDLFSNPASIVGFLEQPYEEIDPAILKEFEFVDFINKFAR